jgi:phosphopantothenoylcysteine decarboxylase/phosphopantothenate--cysteine ligase
MYSRKRRRKLQFLITAGGTREYIDPVRFISNASSGKMGYSLAASAIAAGHSVMLITAPTNLETPKGAKVIRVESARDMFNAVRNNFGGCDCLIMAAAVSDYTPAKPARKKIKKNPGAITMKLKPTRDILKWAGARKKQTQIVVGFALEDRNIKSRAERKLRDKNLNMIVANKPTSIGSERTRVWIKKAGEKWLGFPDISKKQAADRLIRLIEQAMRKD